MIDLDYIRLFYECTVYTVYRCIYTYILVYYQFRIFNPDGTNNVQLSLELFAPIEPDESHHRVRGSSIYITLKKQSHIEWPRLCTTKVRVNSS